ncbi:MAG: hypothetical protein ACPGQS_14130, partial [Bradymonadia bacterium]
MYKNFLAIWWALSVSVLAAGCYNRPSNHETIETRERVQIKLDAPNELGMDMVKIPAGRFGGKKCKIVTRVCPKDDPSTVWDEAIGCSPKEEKCKGWGWGKDGGAVVTLTRPFYLSKTEVTQKQYAEVMGNNPSAFTPG